LVSVAESLDTGSASGNLPVKEGYGVGSLSSIPAHHSELDSADP
jgi:hypothetical protein